MDIITKLYATKNVSQRFSCNTQVTLTLDKPAYIGMCILDLSKVLMYKFYYDYIKNKYGSNSEPLFTDTDSVIYEIKMEDFYEDFSKDLIIMIILMKIIQKILIMLDL